jgi:hypothetical protein
MRITITFLFLLLSLASYEQGFDYQKDFKPMLANTKDTTGNLSYKKLLDRFIANDSMMRPYEVLALMIGFTGQPEYQPYDDMVTEKAIFDLNDQGDYEEARNESSTYLATHPVSLRILKEKSYSLHQLKQRDSAEYYIDLVDKIMAAMKFSGNGRDPETPMFALGLADGEHYTLNKGMAIGSKGTGTNKSKQFMEIIDAIKEDGDHISLFFLIQHAADVHNASLIPKQKKSGKKKSKSTKEIQEEKPAGGS